MQCTMHLFSMQWLTILLPAARNKCNDIERIMLLIISSLSWLFVVDCHHNPGPGAYNPQKPFGQNDTPAYSLRKRLEPPVDSKQILPIKKKIRLQTTIYIKQLIIVSCILFAYFLQINQQLEQVNGCLKKSLSLKMTKKSLLWLI